MIKTTIKITLRRVVKMNIDKNKLDVIMAKQCLSSEMLSKITGVSQVTIARLKRGVQQPRPVTVGKIANALGVKVEDLID